jgi:hypothetical protein
LDYESYAPDIVILRIRRNAAEVASGTGERPES